MLTAKLSAFITKQEPIITKKFFVLQKNGKDVRVTVTRAEVGEGTRLDGKEQDVSGLATFQATQLTQAEAFDAYQKHASEHNFKHLTVVEKAYGVGDELISETPILAYQGRAA